MARSVFDEQNSEVAKLVDGFSYFDIVSEIKCGKMPYHKLRLLYGL
jgi:hypothetical protein